MKQPQELSKELQEMLTPQESILLGIPSRFNPRNDNEYYRPWQFREEGKVIDPRVVREKRENLEFIQSDFVAAVLGLKGKKVAISLSPLNEYGWTQEDPRVLGIVNPKTGKVEEVPGRDLTKEIYEKFAKAEIDLHLRSQSKDKEQQPQGGEAKG